jgi:hypothetical protein
MPELVLGRDGSCLRKAFIDNEELGELLCCGMWGRGALAKMLSSELVSVEEGSVEVDPCWPLLLYGRDEENWVPLLDLLSLN